MAALASLRPGVLLGEYPQKQNEKVDHLEQRVARFVGGLKERLVHQKYHPQFIVSQVNAFSDELVTLSEQELDQYICQLRADLSRQGLRESLIFRSFATIREVSHRITGKRHFDVQLFGGWLMINGMIAEMETGQGKTLTSSLASCTAALAGIPVHVITTNDYLASRDAKILRPIYARLGLSVGIIVDGMATADRQHSYRCDITHACNKQLAFDYLRDRVEMGEESGQTQLKFKQIRDQQQGGSKLLMRGLCYAIVDEADSVLIDEARTPLILSKECPNLEQEQVYHQAGQLVGRLQEQVDFILNIPARSIDLTEEGKQRLAEYVQPFSGFWQGRKRRELIVTQALTAEYLFEKDKHYLVMDGKVQIVDENTGRVMADRSWEQGLHQLIEVKERCKLTAPKQSLARISYQRFFRRYLRLAGMSGTVNEVASELGDVYGLVVKRVPTHTPSKRKILPQRVYVNVENKKIALIKRIQEIHNQGRPLLIGTCSVAASDELSRLLSKHNLRHKVLTARQDKQEAEIIAQAGHRGSIVIATNIAGRGTDIELGAGVSALGGLHVIVTERNIALRVDRQLHGRTARQGDPGSVETFLSLDDVHMVLHYSTILLRLLARLTFGKQQLPRKLGEFVVRRPQRKLEQHHRSVRMKLLKEDQQLKRKLAFSGVVE